MHASSAHAADKVLLAADMSEVPLLEALLRCMQAEIEEALQGVLRQDLQSFQDLALRVLGLSARPALVCVTLAALRDYLNRHPRRALLGDDALMPALVDLLPQPAYRCPALQCITKVCCSAWHLSPYCGLACMLQPCRKPFTYCASAVQLHLLRNHLVVERQVPAARHDAHRARDECASVLSEQWVVARPVPASELQFKQLLLEPHRLALLSVPSAGCGRSAGPGVQRAPALPLLALHGAAGRYGAAARQPCGHLCGRQQRGAGARARRGLLPLLHFPGALFLPGPAFALHVQSCSQGTGRSKRCAMEGSGVSSCVAQQGAAQSQLPWQKPAQDVILLTPCALAARTAGAHWHPGGQRRDEPPTAAGGPGDPAEPDLCGGC